MPVTYTLPLLRGITSPLGVLYTYPQYQLLPCIRFGVLNFLRSMRPNDKALANTFQYVVHPTCRGTDCSCSANQQESASTKVAIYFKLLMFALKNIVKINITLNILSPVALTNGSADFFARQSSTSQTNQKRPKKMAIKQHGNGSQAFRSFLCGLKKFLCGLKKFSCGLNEKISGETLQRFASKRCSVSAEILQRFARDFFAKCFQKNAMCF